MYIHTYTHLPGGRGPLRGDARAPLRLRLVGRAAWGSRSYTNKDMANINNKLLTYIYIYIYREREG